MRLTFSQLSLTGPVREINEDFLGVRHPANAEEARTRGWATILADGVGGESRGEVASQLAVTAALAAFDGAEPMAPAASVLRAMVNTASKAVFDMAMKTPSEGRMATTLTVSLIRDNTLHVAHVGDTRAYLIRKGTVRRLTTDHCYVAMPVKFRLMHEHMAMTSPMRSVLTRSVGGEPIARYDIAKETLEKADVIVQCTDGLYGFVTDDEIWNIASHFDPEEAIRKLMALAEKRQVDDNISVQIIRIDDLDLIANFKGQPVYLNELKSNTTSELEPGQVLDGRFEATEQISRSGMASIFKAKDLKTGEVVALKVPFMHFESDMATYTRFQREEEIGRQLNHPFILKVIPTDAPKSRPYLAMEFLKGTTLNQVMEKTKPLPEKEAARICVLICDALAHMHERGIVHRDLKPDNIMVCDDGSIRIIDFGIAKASKMRRLTFVGFSPTMGTPDYMAPEQVNGRRGDHRTDIYSLGAILYEMVTGKVPFEGESAYAIMNARTTGDPTAPRKLNPNLTPVIEEIILHALSRVPDDRYQDVSRMKAELQDYELVDLIGRHRELKAARTWDKTGRFRMIPLVALFLVGWVLLSALTIWWFTHHQGRH